MKMDTLNADFDYKSLSAEQKNVYNYYKNNAAPHSDHFAGELNGMLRRGEKLEKWQSWSDLLDKVVLSGRSLRPKILFRATNECYVRKQIKKGIITDPGFMSTADVRSAVLRHLNDFQAGQFAIIEIHCDRDRIMIPMDTSPENGASECEWLLPRNSKLEILNERIMSNESWLRHLFKAERMLYSDLISVTYFETTLIF